VDETAGDDEPCRGELTCTILPARSSTDSNHRGRCRICPGRNTNPQMGDLIGTLCSFTAVPHLTMSVHRYHAHTRETTWSIPDEYKEAISKVQQQQTNGLPPMPPFVAGGTQQFGQAPQNNERALAVPGQMMEAGNDGSARPMAMPTGYASSDKNDPQYSTYDEAETAFLKLLRRSGVQADWTWEKAMRVIIKEPQYRALKDPKDRKTAFEKYIVELKQQEHEKAKDRIAKLRQDFSVMLKSHPEIKHYTRWR
jgi:pre-mRNA-processing factor 40